MGLETNEESIIALEKQIEDGNGDIIQLKRARNSLLNISMRVPPEILGDIFSWILVRPDPDPDSESHFNRLPTGSYKFLLVCHHWFQVASHTPKLWTYCGNSLQDWEKWHHLHPQVIPLDLVLKDKSSRLIQPFVDDFIDPVVEDALRDRAARDTIRQVHLLCRRGSSLSLAISIITPEGEGVQCRSIESIDLRNLWWDNSSPDVSSFLARVRLPKLRSLLLLGPLKPHSWDHIAQQTTLLTTLSIHTPANPALTTPQFLSLLASNPGLEVLSLSGSAIPDDNGGTSVSQVTLRHLKHLDLYGELRRVIWVSERLIFPHPLNSLRFGTRDSTVESVLQVLSPYVRLYFQGDHVVLDRLRLNVLPFHDMLISVENEGGVANYTPFSARFHVNMAHVAPHDLLENLCHDFVTSIGPWLDRVCVLHTGLHPSNLEDILIAMPNIETLTLVNPTVSEGFLQPNPDGPYAGSKLLPSLRTLYLIGAASNDPDWRALKAYLGHPTSDCRAISLAVSSYVSHMCSEVVKEIEGLVWLFSCGDNMTTRCPLGRCKGGVEKSGRKGGLDQLTVDQLGLSQWL